MDTLLQQSDIENLKANYFIAENKLNKARKIKMREKMDCINTKDIVRLKELNKEEEVLQKELNTAYDAWQKVKDATRAEDMRERLDRQKEIAMKHYVDNYEDIKVRQRGYYKKKGRE